MLLLLRHLDRDRFDPTLCLFAREGPFLDHVPADIPVVLAVGAFVVWLERARHRKAETKRDSDREERVSVRR